MTRLIGTMFFVFIVALYGLHQLFSYAARPSVSAASELKPFVTGTNFTTVTATGSWMGTTIATVSVDGEVKIDWSAVDKCMAVTKACDVYTLVYARLLTAVRDKTWKPLK